MVLFLILFDPALVLSALQFVLARLPTPALLHHPVVLALNYF